MTVNDVDPIPAVLAPPTATDNLTPVPVSVVEPIPLLETQVITRFEKDGEVSYEEKDGFKPLDAWGGPFAATKGLIQDFGTDRIKDTPISEAGVLGAAIGAALTGTRPVVDLMYFDFVTVAYDQLLSNAAKSRYMFGGQTKVPLTMFARSGAGTGHAAQHSESF